MPLTKTQKNARAQRRTVDRLGVEPFTGTTGAAEIVGVEKTNLGRDFVNTGRLKTVQRLASGLLFLVSECEALRDELEAERKARKDGHGG